MTKRDLYDDLRRCDRANMTGLSVSLLALAAMALFFWLRWT